MNIEEARQKLEDVAGNFYLARTSIMEAADAYGDARELKGHVDACGKRGPRIRAGGYLVATIPSPKCGDGWLCPQAKEIEEPGK